MRDLLLLEDARRITVDRLLQARRYGLTKQHGRCLKKIAKGLQAFELLGNTSSANDPALLRGIIKATALAQTAFNGDVAADLARPRSS